MGYPSRPNLFIVGAPKCGTTALYTYLGQHPDIFMARRKELHFFSSDICGNQRPVTTMVEYLRHFEESAGKPVIGEASTTYLASKQAAYAIREFNPSARIIVMLRNPIDVMYAEHNERLLCGGEHIRDFECALDSQEVRTWQWGRFKGETVNRPNYREIATFSRPLQRYFDVVGKENVHVIIYDDLAADPSATYQQVLSFLRLQPHYLREFQVVNANRRLHSISVQRLLRHPPSGMRWLAQICLPSKFRNSLGKTLLQLNSKFAERPVLRESFRARVARDCKQDLAQLGEILNRDFSRWLESSHPVKSNSP